MYLIVIYSFIITAFIAILLHHFQQKNIDEEHKQTKSIIVTSFFIFIVTLVSLHLLGFGNASHGEGNVIIGGNSIGKSGAIDYEKQMLQSINQSMHTGFAPF